MSEANKIIQRFETLKSDRAVLNDHLQEISDLGRPGRRFNTTFTAGERVFDHVYDETLPMSGMQFAGALHGMLINPAIKWFVLGIEDQALTQRRNVRLWLEQATNAIHAIFNDPSSNFTGSGHETLADLVYFGTAVRLREALPGRIRFTSKPLSDCYVDWNEGGDVQDVFRGFSMTAAEVVARWGDKVSEETKRFAENPKKAFEPVEILHHVSKRDARDPTRSDGANKPWRSVYMEMRRKHILSEGGFDRMPYLAPRWERLADEEYGRSIAMATLPAVRLVNAMVRTNIQARELAVMPPLMVESDGVEGPIRTRPNSLTYIRSGTGSDPVRPMNTGARPDVGDFAINDVRDSIRRAFFNDIFRLPENDRMTATEIIERANQRLQLLSPMTARIEREWLDQDVTWTFEVLRERRIIPDPPPELVGVPFEIQYLSPLAISQRSSEAQSFLQLMNLAQPLVQVDPGAIQNINADETLRYLGNVLNVSERIFRSREEVAQIRQQQQQAQQLAQQAEIAATAAGAAESGANALSRIQGGAR